MTKGSLREGYFCRHSFAFIVITVLRVFPEDEASNLLVQLLYRTVCPDCCLFLITPSCVTEKEWAKKLRLTLGTIHLVWEDIKNSFQWVIENGLKPTQFFSFQNISTNTVARDVQSFGRNGPWLAGWLSSNQNFCANLAQTCDEHMLKISKRYLDSYLNYC